MHLPSPRLPVPAALFLPLPGRLITGQSQLLLLLQIPAIQPQLQAVVAHYPELLIPPESLPALARFRPHLRLMHLPSPRLPVPAALFLPLPGRLITGQSQLLLLLQIPAIIIFIPLLAAVARFPAIFIPPEQSPALALSQQRLCLAHLLLHLLLALFLPATAVAT